MRKQNLHRLGNSYTLNFYREKKKTWFWNFANDVALFTYVTCNTEDTCKKNNIWKLEKMIYDYSAIQKYTANALSIYKQMQIMTNTMKKLSYYYCIEYRLFVKKLNI